MGLSLACLVGCATASQVSQRLDSKTGVTFTFSSTPMILYRDAPAHAANARNFVSLGPLQANRSGRYEYFIWLGIWTTNHSVDGLGGRDGFDSIVLFADGEPLTLDLSGLDARRRRCQ